MKEKKMTFLVILTFILGVAVFFGIENVSAAEGKTMYVNSEIGLNIRDLPDVNTEPFDTVEYQTALTVIGDAHEPGWVFINYNGAVKCVHEHFLQEEKPADLIKQEEETEISSGNLTYWGNCTITHYCNCSACCGQWAGGATASGTTPTAGRTVACGALPFGTHIMVNGQEYVVEDRGVNGYWIDIYCSSHSEACARGMFSADVYIVN